MTLEKTQQQDNTSESVNEASKPAVAQNGDASHSEENHQLFQPPQNLVDASHCKSIEQYKSMHKESVENAETFWKQIAKEFYFNEKQPDGTPFFEYNFDVTKGPIKTTWLKGAKTNISYNCLDRNILEKNLGKSIAYLWEGNDPEDHWEVTYEDLLKEVCKLSNALKSLGIKKGDRVAIYMPMVVELSISLLACARIGAVHSVVFGGYSADSLAERILDAKSAVLITADGAWRGDKIIHLKEIGDQALERCKLQNHEVKHCIVLSHLNRLHQAKRSSNDSPVKRTQYDYKAPFSSPRDKYYHELIANEPDTCTPEWCDSEDPLFILYTSGSTGKPKGVLHTISGYMLYAATTFKYVFDYHDQDIYWCTADIGWITGHTYVCYGPLLNGATSVIFEGTPFHPSVSRLWEIIEKYKVNQFYTAPTAIRSLMKFGDAPVKKHNLDSLKILGSVGEPINPEAWLWYHRKVGHEKCAIVDTFWQTETGGHVITPLPAATSTKPGSATFPFFGVVPELVSEEGKVIEGAGEGYLVFKQPWPGIMRTVYGDQERFETTYFKKFPGYYCTGDGAKRDADGYIWITGRVDDMLNVSGHLLSTAQVESALIEHSSVSESAAVAVNHDVKGEALYCFVTLTEGHEFDKKLVAELKQKVREKIGAFATPETIQQAPALPKTRSGKIMRRILRKIAAGDNEFGDISTLSDESVIQLLIEHKSQGH